MLNKEKPFVYFGGDYNPDQWDEKTIDEDMMLFQKAGINVITLPMFSWAKIEPSEGVYNFEWLDAIMSKAWEHGIYVILATPTTAQPAWLSKKYSDVLPVDIAGRKRTHGMRVFFCVNSVNYRKRAAAIAQQMAKRYANFEGLVAWHVSNEYGTYCYCENCQNRFRQWLLKRYGSLEKLNEHWHTVFWGRTLHNIDEVMLPTELNDDYRFNPNIQLDYMRFMTDSTIECYHNEADILKSANPNIPVFTNISGFIKKLNQFKMVPEMDFAAWDNYPTPGQHRSVPALKHNIMRAAKEGKAFLVAEQSPNQQNWQPYNKLKKPGEIRRLAYQGLAFGADSSLYFQMRQSIAGQEKNHGAFITNAGHDTRIFKEACEMGKEFKLLDKCFLGGRIKSDVAMVFDWDNWWALELSSGPSEDLDYFNEFHKYYKMFYDKNVPVDIVKTSSSFDEYKVLVLPMLYLLKDDVHNRVKTFVENGGVLIATYMTGRVDENDRYVFGAYPGPLKDVLGIWVEETDALYPEETNSMKIVDGFLKESSYNCGFLCDVIHATTAEVLAVYGEDFYANTPVLTKNKYGKGEAYYLASRPSDEFLNEFANKICQQANLSCQFEYNGDLEISTRENEQGKTTFIINYGKNNAEILLPSGKYYDKLKCEFVSGNYILKAGDIAVLFCENN